LVKRTVVLRLVLFHQSQSLPKRWLHFNYTFPAKEGLRTVLELALVKPPALMPKEPK
jgi:hypothetical protein